MRLYLLRDMVKLPIMLYVREVLFKLLPVAIISFAIPSLFLLVMESGGIRLIVICIVSLLVTSSTEYFVGFSNNEQKFIKDKIRLVLRKIYR